MGEFSSRRSRIHNMQALVLVSMVAAAIAAPSAEPKADPYGFYGHHVYHGPPCKHAFVEETKEICHLKPNRVCETETQEVCKKEPVVEEKSKDFELCHIEPEKVCEEKTIKVPTLDCEEEEEEEE